MQISILYNHDHDALDFDPGRAAREDVVRMAAALGGALTSKSHQVELVAVGRRPFHDLEHTLQYPPDVAINLCESIWGDARGESVVPMLLELAGIPYTGSTALSLLLALHKPKAKELLRARGLPTPEWSLVENSAQLSAVDMAFPLIVKPSREDGSCGVHAQSVVRDERALERAVREVLGAFKQPALVERYIEGREIGVALLGNPPQPLPLSEIDFSALPPGLPPIVTYAGKWDERSLEYLATPSVASSLDGAAAARAVEVACAAFAALECRDYGRVDLRVDASGQPYVIDINANCDLSPDAGFARAAHRAGLAYPELAESLVHIARSRHGAAPAASPRPPAPLADAGPDRAVHPG